MFQPKPPPAESRHGNGAPPSQRARAVLSQEEQQQLRQYHDATEQSRSAVVQLLQEVCIFFFGHTLALFTGEGTHRERCFLRNLPCFLKKHLMKEIFVCIFFAFPLWQIFFFRVLLCSCKNGSRNKKNIAWNCVQKKTRSILAPPSFFFFLQNLDLRRQLIHKETSAVRTFNPLGNIWEKLTLLLQLILPFSSRSQIFFSWKKPVWSRTRDNSEHPFRKGTRERRDETRREGTLPFDLQRYLFPTLVSSGFCRSFFQLRFRRSWSNWDCKCW